MHAPRVAIATRELRESLGGGDVSGSEKESDRWSQSVLDDASLIFVSDSSAEAAQLAQALRAAGYTVLDVPQSLLVGRVSAQPPRVILMDVSAEGALEVASRVRDLEMISEIDVIYLGELPGVVQTDADAVIHHGSAQFSRPVDVKALTAKIDGFTGGASERRSSIPPSMPSAPASRRSLPSPSQAPSGWPEVRPSLAPQRPPSTRAPRPSPLLPPIPYAVGDENDDAPPPLVSRPSAMGSLSPELATILSEAEARVGGNLSGDESFTTPEDEIEAVLPAEVLASLDDPLDEEEDEEVAEIFAHSRGNTSTGGKQETTGSERFQTEPPVTGGTGSDVRHPTDRFVSSPSPRASTVAKIPSEVVANARKEAASASQQPASTTDESAGFSQFPGPGGSVQPAAAVLTRALSGEDARHLIASAIAARDSGALCFTEERGVRRLVVRDGDLVTAASGVTGEHVLDYLVARGDMPKHHADRLIPKLPPYGRLAGAALVAQGYLSQDQMWPVLRGHAEWIVGSLLGFDLGTYSFEIEPPGRLATEPSVFGASPGVEVFVDLMRRNVSQEEALQRLGGIDGVLALGQNAHLLSEAALEAFAVERFEACLGEPLSLLLHEKSENSHHGAGRESDLASVAYALFLLGVYDVVPTIGGRRDESRSRDDEEPASDSRALDDEAVRVRVEARLALVEEGDYFSLLGVPHDATGYEIRRAFLDLRHSFEPSRALTPGTLDLAPELAKIVDVLEEAYDVLKDATRRERYRRAISSVSASR